MRPRARPGRSSSYWSARSSRTSPASSRCAVVPVRVVLALGAAIQLVPLAAPLLLSTDAWTYWGYGWIASDGGGNPYVDPPADFPQSPAAAYVGADWRDTTTVYGPVFTLLSEPVALLAGSSADAAAWLFRGPRRPPCSLPPQRSPAQRHGRRSRWRSSPGTRCSRSTSPAAVTTTRSSAGSPRWASRWRCATVRLSPASRGRSRSR